MIPMIFNAQTAVIDSLKSALNVSESAKEKVKIYNDLGWEFLYLTPENTRAYADSALIITENSDDPFGRATAFGTLGLYYDVSGDYDQAIESYLAAIEILEPLEEYDQNLAANYSNLSLIFRNVEDPEKAIYYAKKALLLEQKSGQKQGEIYSYINLAVMYGEIDQPDSSLFYHRKAMQTGRKHGLDDYKTDFVNLGNLFIRKNETDSAEHYYTRYLEFSREKDMRKNSRLAYAYSGMANLYMARGELEMGKAYADSAYELSILLQYPRFRIEVLEHWITYHESKQEYRKALEYLRERQSLSDSIASLELKETAKTLEQRFQNKQNQSRIRELEAENKIKELSLYRSQNQRLLFLIIAILSIITLGITTIFLVSTRKTSVKLKAQNEMIQTLIRENHHRVKNNLQVISSMLSLQALTTSSPEAKTAIEDAYSRVKTIALLHHKLQESQDFETIQLDTFLKQLSEVVIKGLKSGLDKVSTLFRFEEATRVDINYAISMGLILNELITNSFKYALRNGEELQLSLELKSADSGIKLRYVDNGPGFPRNFDPIKASSLGFTIINSLISQHQGKLATSNENGAVIEIYAAYGKTGDTNSDRRG